MSAAPSAEPLLHAGASRLGQSWESRDLAGGCPAPARCEASGSLGAHQHRPVPSREETGRGCRTPETVPPGASEVWSGHSCRLLSGPWWLPQLNMGGAVPGLLEKTSCPWLCLQAPSPGGGSRLAMAQSSLSLLSPHWPAAPLGRAGLGPPLCADWNSRGHRQPPEVG